MEIREIKPTSIKALEIKRVAAYARVSRDSQTSEHGASWHSAQRIISERMMFLS